MTQLYCFILLLACTQAENSFIDEYLHSQLESFDVVDPIKIVSKRSLSDDAPTHLYINALNRSFHLVLRHGYAGSVTAGLSVQVVRTNVTESFDASELFSDFVYGYVDGRPNSRVSGYHAEDGIHLTIEDGADVVTLEPLSRFTRDPNDKRVLVYREASVKPSDHFCGASALFNRSSAAAVGRTPAAGTPPVFRDRRAAATVAGEISEPPLSRVCRLQLVADHTFVRHIASGNVGSTVKCLIKIADDINLVYRGTKFVHPDTGEVFTGIGFELANLRVFENPDPDSLHFNVGATQDYQYIASHYLEAFGDYEINKLELTRYCLNHLVTFRPMQQNILGLAYLGSQYGSYIGGICSQPSSSTYGRNRLIGRNIGMATYANKDGKPILSRQALLVSAHELGHNMGSEHDPVQEGMCSPSWANGGPYLMYQIAVTGNADHHSRFSDCSAKQIALVIKARQQNCFDEPRNTFCGNQRREDTEECDAGPLGDPCCDEKCRLRQGASCTDRNYPCCLNCRPAPAGLLCQRQSQLHPCQANTTCNGTSVSCPTPASLPNGTPCQFNVGACFNGKCDSVCSRLGQQPCSCQSEAASCLVCCQPVAATDRGVSNASACVPYRRPGDGATVSLPANQPCAIGRCLANGTCQKPEPGSGQLIVRLWDLIAQSGSSTFATLLWKNIVFTVILLSLIVWLPACCIIAYQDRRDVRDKISGSGAQ